MRFLVIATILLAPALASADPTPARDVQQMHTDDCAKARKLGKTCVLDMGNGTDIEGQAPTAGGSAINLLQFIKANSLVHIRTDFVPEILKAAEDL